jgi:hypothetical protein
LIKKARKKKMNLTNVTNAMNRVGNGLTSMRTALVNVNFGETIKSYALPIIGAIFMVMCGAHAITLMKDKSISNAIPFVFLAVIGAGMIFLPDVFKEVLIAIFNKVVGN